MQNTQTCSRSFRALVLAGILIVAAPCALFASGASEPPATVTVIGEGELFAEPDQAAITLGLQRYDESAQTAAAELRERMEAVDLERQLKQERGLVRLFTLRWSVV